jgi:hypothetical protein
MTNTTVALAAGVTEKYVRQLRQQEKSSDSIDQVGSESSKKRVTGRGLRPATYNTKKKKAFLTVVRKFKNRPNNFRPAFGSDTAA